MRITAVLSCLLLAANAYAQSGIALAGAGYGIGASVVAPGQIVNLEVTGMAPISSSSPQRATSVPLPSELAGISVVVTQSVQATIMGTAYVYSYNAAMVSVTQTNLCSSFALPACLTTYLTLQMPYELEPGEGPSPIIQTTVTITQNGASSRTPIAVWGDQIHVVTHCEDPTEAECSQIVAHLDGTLVSVDSPAQPGETVVVYAWGLGQTQPLAVTGAATGTPAPVVTFPGNPASGSGSLSRPTPGRRVTFLTPRHISMLI